MRDARRWRMWLEMTLSGVSGILAVLTLVWRDWIELVFHVDPDHHDGSLEWLIVVGLLVVAVLVGAAARRDWRLSRHQEGPAPAGAEL